MTIQKGPSGALGTTIEAGEIANGAVTPAKLSTGGPVWDTSSNVGIGQSPSHKLDILGSTARIYNDDATLLLQRPGNGRSGKVLVNNANGGLKYYAGNNGSGENGTVAHEFTSDAPSTGTVLARINSYGIGLGANTPSSGMGITFPATQSASSDANTLDDYEEGTWTPGISPNGGGTFSYTSSGFYTKVGRNVYITGSFRITDPGTASGTANFSGLPFTAFNTSFAAGNRSSMGVCREDAVTGLYYLFFITSNTTTAQMSTTTGGAITWTTNYTYTFTATYQSTT